MTDLNTKFLSQVECNDLADMMQQKYGLYLDGRSFEVTAETQPADVVLVKALLRNEDDSFHYPVEARMKYKTEEMSPREAAIFLIDYLDVYFEEYFEDDSLFLPIDWSDHVYCGTEFQVRGQIFNLKVEKMADELLKKNEKYDGPNLII